VSNYTMSDPPSVCSLSPTHPPLSFHCPLNIRSSSPTRPRTRTHTWSHIRTAVPRGSNRLPLFTLPRDPGVAVPRPFLSLAMDHFIAPVLPEAETRWPPNISDESVITLSPSLLLSLSLSLSLSLFLSSYYNSATRTVAFWRRCSNSSTLIRKKSLATR